MRSLDKTSWEVLNATADDCENLEQIYRQVCFELLPLPEKSSAARYDYRLVDKAPLLYEVAESLRMLVSERLLSVLMDEDGHPWKDPNDLSFVWRAWFQMTAKGRLAWESSEHLQEQNLTS